MANTSQRPLTPEQSFLVQEYLPLVDSAVRKFAYTGHAQRQDMWSAGVDGLIQAALESGKSRRKTFGGYAKIKIRGAILDMFRRVNGRGRSRRVWVSMEEKIAPSSEQSIEETLTDSNVKHPSLDLTNAEIMAAVKDQISKMKPIPKHVATRFFIDRATTLEIAKEVNRTRSRVHQIVHAAMPQLRSAIIATERQCSAA